MFQQEQIGLSQFADVAMTGGNICIQWWSLSRNGNIRNNYCMEELLFAENHHEVRRNAQRNGWSINGRQYTDASWRGHYLRTFATWYLGLDNPLDSDKAIENSTRLDTYDFTTGKSIKYQTRWLFLPQFLWKCHASIIILSQSTCSQLFIRVTMISKTVSSLFGQLELLQTILISHCPRMCLSQ